MLRTVEEDEKVLEEIKLFYLDGENLMDMECAPHAFCIDALLPQGLCILGGAPKVGKSWLVLDWCLRIAKGEPVWDRRTRKGTTLYLCLEDTYERVQKRLSFMTDDIPKSICFANASGTLADTLEEQIRFFLRERPDTVLVVIDTFQMVRASSGDPSYGGDYQEVEKLKQLADKLRITILLVHHLRKQDDRDPVNRLSGTTGISGAADAIFVLEKKERTQSAALMKCTGRDIEDRVLEVQFSKEDYVWELVSESGQDAGMPKVMDAFLGFMKEKESFSGGNTELAEAFTFHTGERIEPKRLKQLMNVWKAQLLEQGVSFHSHRSNGQRLVEDFPADNPAGVGADARSGMANSAGGETGSTETGAPNTPTGWEREREIFLRYVQNALGKSQGYGGYRPAFGEANFETGGLDLHPFGGAFGLGLRGAAALGRVAETESDDPEERRRRQEAQQAASNLGAVIGLTVGAAMALKREEREALEQEEYNEFIAEQEQREGLRMG